MPHNTRSSTSGKRKYYVEEGDGRDARKVSKKNSDSSSSSGEIATFVVPKPVRAYQNRGGKENMMLNRTNDVTWEDVSSCELFGSSHDQRPKMLVISRSSVGHMTRSLRLEYTKNTTTSYFSITLRPEIIDSFSHPPCFGSYSYVSKGSHSYLLLPSVADSYLLAYAKDGMWLRGTVTLSPREMQQISIFCKLHDYFYIHGEAFEKTMLRLCLHHCNIDNISLEAKIENLEAQTNMNLWEYEEDLEDIKEEPVPKCLEMDKNVPEMEYLKKILSTDVHTFVSADDEGYNEY